MEQGLRLVEKSECVNHDLTEDLGQEVRLVFHVHVHAVVGVNIVAVCVRGDVDRHRRGKGDAREGGVEDTNDDEGSCVDDEVVCEVLKA